MGTRGYVGCPDATDPTVVHLRYVHSDAVPEDMVPALTAIQQLTFSGDTAATVTALLRRTWAYLGADVTTDDTFLAGDTPIAGVGMAIDAAPTDPPTAVPVARLDELSGPWVYLIDPAANTLTVLSTDDPDHPVARYTFTAPPTPPTLPAPGRAVGGQR
ncbi:hypothetical protein AB0H83_35100 [Dactylosporangium sp. NPDC050688]|uniref:hypothetical protein n=1 Tax=Dactylosporangium sp. NPDC050688 TaxID=3157217 RepID=UPI0033FF6ED5